MRLLLSLFLLIGLSMTASCAVLGLDGGSPPVPTSFTSELVYEGAITLSMRNGKTLPGTTLAYQGKSADGRALILFNGQQAAKQLADSVFFTGSPLPGVMLTINTRVGTYDQNAVNLLGTVRVAIQDAHPSPAELGPDVLTAYSIPVQYNVNRDDAIPGTVVQYLGQDAQGGRFTNIGEYPYRQQFDSVVWSGRLRDKVGIKADLRIVSISAESVALFGTAQLLFEK